MTLTQATPNKVVNFPFKLEDLKSWSLKRVDGTVTKFVLTQSAITNSSTHVESHTATKAATGSYSDYCHHKPTDIPIVQFVRSKELGDIKLHIGNMGGAKATKDTFDFVVDCGDIFSSWASKDDEILSGDQELAASLSQYTVPTSSTRILKIDWSDRQSPNVIPEFWVELNKLICGDVMTCCVGGHGRSGTSFVCLLLVNAPDYDALDAITHIRAVHCPRAIESESQHDYINDVAKFLGRKANAKDASTITDYKGAFMVSKKPTTIATRKMLGWAAKLEK